MNPPLIMSLSPRRGGNSDAVAGHFSQSLARPLPVRRLCDHDVHPCLGCSLCAGSGQCVLAGEDRVEEIFDDMEAASGLVLVAPVYFYHLPSQAKAWIDRSQSRYLSRLNAGTSARASRPAYVILVAARTAGDKLFAGIVPTLRYFLEIFDFHITDALFLRGLDGPSDFPVDQDACAAVARLARSSGW